MKMKTFNARVLIADGVADSNGNIYDISKVQIDNQSYVPVTDNFQEDIVVGHASLKKVGNEVHADFKLNPDVDPVLVPCIGGLVIASEDKPNGIEQMIIINVIGLSKANADKRIKPLLNEVVK